MAKNNIKNGFVFIEFGIYLCCSAFLISILYSWLGSLSTTWHKIPKALDAAHQTMGALDIFSRSIMESPRHLENWIKTDNKKIMWKSTTTISWYFEKDQLYVVEGEWNMKDNAWKKHTKSLVCDKVKKGEFQVIMKSESKSTCVHACTICLNDMQRTIYLRNKLA